MTTDPRAYALNGDLYALLTDVAEAGGTEVPTADLDAVTTDPRHQADIRAAARQIGNMRTAGYRAEARRLAEVHAQVITDRLKEDQHDRG